METPPAQPGVPVIRMEDMAAGSLADPNVTVVEGINWTVKAADYWVVGGLQGSGKSDFLMVAGGVMAPQRGRYLLFDEEMPIFEDARLAQRLRLGLVFDGGRLFHHLTVRENVALPLRYHQNLTAAQAEAEAEKFLAAMDLLPWADSTPGMVGRNWQKRAGLARALILKPEVLLVDSALGGLDLRHTHWWMRFLDQLSRGSPLLEGRPLTLVVTTADLRPWKSRVCRFAVIRNGRFVIADTWSQLEAESAELVRELPEEGARSG